MKVYIDKMQSSGPKISVTTDDGVVLLNRNISDLPDSDGVLVFMVPSDVIIGPDEDIASTHKPCVDCHFYDLPMLACMYSCKHRCGRRDMFTKKKDRTSELHATTAMPVLPASAGSTKTANAASA